MKAVALLLSICAVSVAMTAPALAAGACSPVPHWIATWEAAPSDASLGSDIADSVDASGRPKLPIVNSTVRVMLTPSLGGREVRVHLSNRFGTGPVTFGHTTIAVRGAGASLTPGTAAEVSFSGQRSVTVPAGWDVVSDPVALPFVAGQKLAVSVFVASDAGKGTEHYTGRQMSYLTLPDGGDHAADVSAGAFVQQTTARPFVSGIDVKARGDVGAVVAFGDSITDGFQAASAAGVPEAANSVDKDGRWPDVLSRRVRAAGLPLSVVNAGISGNRILQPGIAGGNRDVYGPSALTRLSADLLNEAGVRTVIWLEGINDLGSAPQATAAKVIAGLKRGIARMHAARLRVLLGTLTPSGGASGGYGTAATNFQRNIVNRWIRSQHDADGFIDFDAAVRDPAEPSRISPAYDGSDHLHFDLAGYQAMGDAIPPNLLAPPCPSALIVRVSTHHLLAGRVTTLRVTVKTTVGIPVANAHLRLGSATAQTDRKGVAYLRVAIRRRGLAWLVIRASASPVVRVRMFAS